MRRLSKHPKLCSGLQHQSRKPIRRGGQARSESDAWRLSIEKVENRPFLSFQRIPNLSFEVQWTTDLRGADSWQPLQTPGNQPFYSSSDGITLIELPMAGSPAYFYRVKIREP